jgi:hypothetical protein
MVVGRSRSQYTRSIMVLSVSKTIFLKATIY